MFNAFFRSVHSRRTSARLARRPSVLVLGLTFVWVPAAWGTQAWVPAGTGSWFDPGNWSPSGVPTSLLSASINNGGMAQAVGPIPAEISALLLDVGKNGGQGNLSATSVSVAVQGSIDIGDVDSVFAIGANTYVSQGSVTLSNVPAARFGLAGNGDINVGQTSATSPASAMGTATLIGNQVGTISMSGDFDVGQTGGSGQSLGDGTVQLTDVTTQLNIGIDFDIGQTSGVPGSQNTGVGRATLTRVARMDVGADIDLGQATGDGRAAGTGTLNTVDVAVANVGTNLDIGKVRALGAAVNSAQGTATWLRGDLNVGFGIAGVPGSIELGRVLVSETARGNGTGSLTVTSVDVNVANDIIVGQLDLGSTNPLSSAEGTFHAIDSHVRTRDLMVGQRLNNTAGTVSGRVQLTRTLLSVQSLLSLAGNSTFQFDLAGTVRADGSGDVDQYGAIDADMADVGGTLAILPLSTYADPTLAGTIDAFGLIETLFGLTGRFGAVTYNGQSLTPDFGSLATGFSDHVGQGLFRIVSYENNAVTFSNYRALPGDANGDFVVDGSDFNLWNSHKFTSGTNWTTGDFNGDGITDGSDFNIWNSNKFTSARPGGLVPEPANGLSLLVVTGWGMLSWRRRGLRKS